MVYIVVIGMTIKPQVCETNRSQYYVILGWQRSLFGFFCKYGNPPMNSLANRKQKVIMMKKKKSQCINWANATQKMKKEERS